jgi:hypothetical protein
VSICFFFPSRVLLSVSGDNNTEYFTSIAEGNLQIKSMLINIRHYVMQQRKNATPPLPMYE